MVFQGILILSIVFQLTAAFCGFLIYRELRRNVLFILLPFAFVLMAARRIIALVTVPATEHITPANMTVDLIALVVSGSLAVVLFALYKSYRKMRLESSMLTQMYDALIDQRAKQPREKTEKQAADEPFDFVVRVSREGVFEYVNRTAPGVTEEELIGKKTVFDYTDAAFHDEVRAAFQQVFETGVPAYYESYAEITDSWYGTVVGPVYKKGKITSASLLVRDITDKKNAEAAFMHSEERFALFMDFLPGLAQIKDKEHRFVYLNDAFESTFKINKHDWFGKRVDEIFSEKIAAPIRESDEKVFTTGKPVKVMEALEQDGVVHHYLTYKFPIQQNGNVELLGSISIDFTDLKRTQEELQEAKEDLEKRVAERTKELKELNENLQVEVEKQAEHLFYQAADAISDMVLVKGPESKIVWANQSFRDFYGMSNEALKSIIDAPFNKPDYTQQYIKDDLHVFETGEVLDIPDEPVTRHDGVVRHFHTVKSAIRDRDGKVVMTVGVSRDITDRKDSEDREKVLRQKLIETDKMAAIGLLGASVAHELNSPLTGLISLLRTSKKKVEGGTQAFKDYDDMLEACNHMAKVVTGLNSFSRESQGEFEQVDIEDVVESVLSFSMSRWKAKNLEIKRDYEKSLPQIEGDKSQLQQIILNLLNNAADAMPNGGEVAIRSYLDGGVVCLDVQDKGCGIAEEYLTRIFEPFYTTKASTRGLGLGLYVSYGIMKRHGGDIAVASKVDQGSTFTLEFAD